DSDNMLVVDLNIPKIIKFYPQDGINQSEVNSYVTIEGVNFGDSQGSSQVLFGEAQAQPADCADAWTDEKIKVIVPKAAPIQALGIKTYDSPQLSAIDAILNYSFDDSGDVLAADTVSSHQGEIHNGTKVDSPLNKALEFNGINTYIQIGGGIIQLTSGSIEMWFKPETSGTLFSANGPAGINFSIDYNANATRSIIKKNQWNHLVYSYDQANAKANVYINGLRLSGITDMGINVKNNFIGVAKTSYMLGKEDIVNKENNYFKGQIDNFTIYNKVLSQQEVWANYGIKPGQIVLLNFEEDGSEITDSSANNFVGMAVSNQSVSFRTAEGKYGQAITFNNDNHINIPNNPSLTFDDQITIEGWFKVGSSSDNLIYDSNNITLGVVTGALKFTAYIAGGNKFAAVNLPNGTALTDWLTKWHYFAGVYDGQKMKIYLDSEESESAVAGKIYQETKFNSACIGGCANIFQGSLDNFALYNRALSSAEINSRLGAKDKSFIKVVTSFGENTSDYNKNGVKDSGEIFSYSNNVYPFLCALQPNNGKEGTVISVSGDNLGKSNKTVYKGKEYGIGSYIKFLNAPVSLMKNDKINSWSNQTLNYVNPFKSDLA
ncbi:MAG: hypothetical protein NT116_02610, partial [Candidatus Parcubacteria bacterium]|nr:hypothetical protein [Candidatus Parcubacteria bacterium]